MSILSRIRQAAHRAGTVMDKFTPWAADLQRAEALRDWDPRVGHEHNQFERAESYAQAMARLTGTDPAAFELEEPALSPETDWPLDRAAEIGMEQREFREQQAEYFGRDAKPEPSRPVAEIRADYSAGRIGREERRQQEDARLAMVGDEAFWEELLDAPLIEWTDAEANAIEREVEAAEDAAGDADLDAEDDEFRSGPYQYDHEDHREHWGEWPNDATERWRLEEDAQGDLKGCEAIGCQIGAPAAAWAKEERLEYLGERAGELAELPETDIEGAADVLGRMSRDGVPSSEIGQVAETASLWRANEATAEADAGQAAEDHVAGYEAAGWPIGMRVAGTADQAISLNEHAAREAEPQQQDRYPHLAEPWEMPAGARPVAEIYADYNAGRINYAELQREQQARADEVEWEFFAEELELAPALELTDADANRLERGLEAAEDAAREDAEDGPDWADLSEEQQVAYLGDRAAEMTADDPNAFGDTVERMANDGVPGEQRGQVLDTARAWRENEATADAELGWATGPHVILDAGLDAEREEPFWPGPTEEFPTVQAWADAHLTPESFPEADDWDKTPEREDLEAEDQARVHGLMAPGEDMSRPLPPAAQASADRIRNMTPAERAANIEAAEAGHERGEAVSKEAGSAYEAPWGFDEVSQRLAREKHAEGIPPRTPAERDYFAHLDKSTRPQPEAGGFMGAPVPEDAESAERGAAAEADRDAWGGRGPSSSYEEWLAEGRETDPPVHEAEAPGGFMGAPVAEDEGEQDWRAAEDLRLAGEREAEREANSYPERFEEAYGQDPEREPESADGEWACPDLDEDWPGPEPAGEEPGALPRGVTPVVNDRGAEIHVVDPAQLGDFLADVNAGVYGQPEADREAGQ